MNGVQGQNQPPTTPLAIWSLALGIASLAFCCLPLGIPAVICGHMARSCVKRGPQDASGSGMALAGLITGYLSIVLTILCIIFGLIAAFSIPAAIKLFKKAQSPVCVENLAKIETAKQVYALEHGKPKGWFWDTDEAAFRDLVKPEAKGYLEEYPVCPACETDGRDIQAASKSYHINAVGVPATCATEPNKHKMKSGGAP
jgi:hypothetical protein